MCNLNEINATVNRVFGKEYKGITLISDCIYYSTYKYEDKLFCILKTAYCVDVDYYTTIRSNKERNNKEINIDIPCLGTIYPVEGLRLWNYKELVNYGWSKSFYRKVTKVLQEKLNGYCYFDKGFHHFWINNYYITINNKEYHIYDSSTEEYNTFGSFYGLNYDDFI